MEEGVTQAKSYCWRCSNLFLFLTILCFRWMNVLLVQTSYNIDEYWQGPEIAYSLVYPDRGGYRTWEW